MTKLSIKQELAINELLKGNSIVDSAKNIGVSETTLNRWIANDQFKLVLNDRKKQIVDNCIDSINLMGNKAIKVLNDILDNEKTSDNIKLNASKTVLDMMLKFNEQNNIIDKIKEIECLLSERINMNNE